MWKSLSSALNRFMQKSYDEAATDKPHPPAPPPPTPPPPQPFTRDQLQQRFQQSVLLLQAGSKEPAEQAMREVVARIAAEQPDSPLHAEALSKLATIHAAAGQWDRSADAARLALAVPAPSDVLRKERLSYQLLLADALNHLGHHDEAEQLLHDGVAERRAVFGPRHPAHAAGLAALAELLLARGRHAEALDSIDRALAIRADGPHDDRLSADLALRAYCIKGAHGAESPSLPPSPAAIQKPLAQHCVKLAATADPRLAQAVLVELRQRLETDQPPDVPLLISIDVALANAARATGDHDARIAACRRMVDLCQPLPEKPQLALAQLAMATALADAAQPDAARSAFDAAADTARQTHRDALLATVLRQYAIWGDGIGDTDRADRLYAESVSHGASSGDWSTHGRCTIAYGNFLLRLGRTDEGRRMLEEAVAHLPPTHPDLPAAQARLRELDPEGGAAA
jgi:tetratricopeptide (TPR) repeat protein